MPLWTTVNCSQEVKRSVCSPFFGTWETASALSSFRHKKRFWEYGASPEERQQDEYTVYEERPRELGQQTLVNKPVFREGEQKIWVLSTAAKWKDAETTIRLFQRKSTEDFMQWWHVKWWAQVGKQEIVFRFKGRECTIVMVGCLSILPRTSNLI